MMLPGHGLGRGSNAGGYAAFGFGINSLTGAIEAAISFTTNVDIDIVRTLTADKDISFALVIRKESNEK